MVNIGLTEKGESDYEKVIQMVYKFINQIRQEGPRGFIYEEEKQKALIDFANVTKTGALEYAETLATRMNYTKDEKDIGNILYAPYAYEEFDEADIMRRLDGLVPENMYAIYHSQLLQKLKEAQPEKFTKERFYEAWFTLEDFSQEFMDHLRTVRPQEAEKLGNAPPNLFMPKAENLVNMKKQRADKEKPGIPKRMPQQNDSSHELWFKQDDTFE